MSEKKEIIHKDLVIKNTTVEGVKDKYITNITIPEGITKIADNAFSGLYALEEIEFPTTLVSIGDYSFRKCSSLKRLVLPESLCEIGEYSFAECQQLVLVDLSKTAIKVIPEDAFRECRKLEEIIFSTSLREIEASAFSHCQSLKNLNLPDGILGVKDSFLGCELDSISIPDSLRYIESISYRKVKSISISEDQYDRFKLVLPKPTEVKYNFSFIIKCPVCGAFYKDCKCKNNCSRMELDGTVLKKANIWQAEFVVPEHITVIGERAFYWKDDLTRVILPASVEKIGKEAFADCKKLEYVNLHKLVNLVSIEDNAFEFCRKLKLDEVSFYALTKLKSIGNCAFMDTAVEKISFTSLDYLGASAFAGCADLESASFYRCKTQFEWGTFSECRNLEEVFLPDTMTEIPNSMFSECESLREIQIPKNVTKICDYAFMGCSSLAEVSVLGPLTTIGKCAFSSCDSLGNDFQFEFLMWDDLEVIGPSAFSGCFGLNHIEIPGKVKTIEKDAFSSCYYIRYFFIPRSVTTIEAGALPTSPNYGCKFDIEAPYKPRGWNVELENDRYKGIIVNWGYVQKY